MVGVGGGGDDSFLLGGGGLQNKKETIKPSNLQVFKVFKFFFFFHTFFRKQSKIDTRPQTLIALGYSLNAHKKTN
jgi:hypothetical protein